MGVFDKLRRIFKRSASMQSDAHRFEAMQIEEQAMVEPRPEQTDQSSLSIEKDSLQLGIAAGYTGRSLREIEAALARIESQMVTKDWITLNLKADLEQRLDTIQSSLQSILSSTASMPSHVRDKIVSEVGRIQAALQPTSKMLQIASVVKEANEISYDDLAARMGIEVSSLRGLLSLMTKRSSIIERFERDNKGWVRYKEPVASMQSDADKKPSIQY